MESENNPGARISIAWGKEEDINFINIRDQEGIIIMKIQKQLWDAEAGVGFTAQTRDAIITSVRNLYG